MSPTHAYLALQPSHTDEYYRTNPRNTTRIHAKPTSVPILPLSTKLRTRIGTRPHVYTIRAYLDADEKYGVQMIVREWVTSNPRDGRTLTNPDNPYILAGGYWVYRNLDLAWWRAHWREVWIEKRRPALDTEFVAACEWLGMAVDRMLGEDVTLYEMLVLNRECERMCRKLKELQEVVEAEIETEIEESTEQPTEQEDDNG